MPKFKGNFYTLFASVQFLKVLCGHFRTKGPNIIFLRKFNRFAKKKKKILLITKFILVISLVVGNK